VDSVKNNIAHVFAQLGKSGTCGVLRDSVSACVLDMVTKRL
jgi:hypothetical protein